MQLTQSVYDALSPEQRSKTPLPQEAVLEAMKSVTPLLLHEDGLVAQHFEDERLQTLIQEVIHITSSEERLISLLTQANAESNRYAQAYGVGAKEKAKK